LVEYWDYPSPFVSLSAICVSQREKVAQEYKRKPQVARPLELEST
jgi:hypothetical protein